MCNKQIKVWCLGIRILLPVIFVLCLLAVIFGPSGAGLGTPPLNQSKGTGIVHYKDVAENSRFV